MPIRQYFVWVGSVLLVALFAADWWLPDPATHSDCAIAANERGNLRIRSDHKWPERIVFDTAHSGMPLAAASELRPDVVPNQDRAQTEQRRPLDAFAAMEAAQATPTATNDKSSAIRAKPRTLETRMTSAAKADRSGADMNDVLTLAVFAAKVLCLIVFVSVLKPDGSIGAVHTSTNLADCRIERSGLQERGPNVFAATSQADVRPFECRSPLKQ